MRVADILHPICYDAGELLAVEYALLEGERRFVTAVRLTFTSRVFVFRAVADDDALAVFEGVPFLERDEVSIKVSAEPPWAACIGRKVQWAWAMVNQQGYEDAVRVEFELKGVGAELVVVASTIRIYAFDWVSAT